MWRQKSAELHAWLKLTPPASFGAKDALRERMGVKPAAPFVPVLAFGLPLAEMNCAPVDEDQGADCTGVQILNSMT